MKLERHLNGCVSDNLSFIGTEKIQNVERAVVVIASCRDREN